MQISKTQNYLVLNHSTSPVSVSTKYESFLIDGGTPDSPGTLPLSFDEIAVINSKSPAFKIGYLRFEPQYEADLYEALAIPNWRDIMTQEQIEDALLNPTLETSQKILDIENEAYFERVRGAMVGLRNAGMDITVKMQSMIEERSKEFARKKRKTEIRLVPHEKEQAAPSQDEFDSLKAQLAEMQKAMAALLAQQSAFAPDTETPQETPRETPREAETVKTRNKKQGNNK